MDTRFGLLTTRFLDLSETFIYEPLQLLQGFTAYAYALQRRNKKQFKYPRVFTLDELPKNVNVFQRLRGKFSAGKSILLKKMKEDNISLLHAHYGYMGIFALSLRKKLKLPLVTSFYGLDVYKHTRSFFYRRQLKQLFKYGDLFLVCSEQMRQDLIALGAPPSRLRVLYGGATLKKFPFSFRPYQPNKPLNILMCGRFVEKKGFVYGVQAFIAAAAKNDNLRLRIIGSGSEEAEIREIINSAQAKDQVEFLGNKNHDEYIKELKQCHIFMSPSVTAQSGDKEGLPTVLIEAAALGKPLLATLHSGIPEIVHEGKNGYLAPERDIEKLAENISRLVEENYRWDDFAEYGRQLVEKEFCLEKQVEKLQRFYQELII
jgi:glycosyltransferase involved in cell wall biosynthesis